MNNNNNDGSKMTIQITREQAECFLTGAMDAYASDAEVTEEDLTRSFVNMDRGLFDQLFRFATAIDLEADGWHCAKILRAALYEAAERRC